MGILAGLWMSVVSAAGLPGEELLLRVGETMEVEGEDLSLRFVEVRSDSRCPKDARCIRAGEAIVVLEARASGREARELILEIPPGGSAKASFEAFIVHVVSLEPPTESGKKIEPSAYVLTVTTEKECAHIEALSALGVAASGAKDKTIHLWLVPDPFPDPPPRAATREAARADEPTRRPRP